jgi:hypothetical protein
VSRIGLGKRLATVEQAIQARFPFGYAVHNLPPNLQTKYARWCRECDDAAKKYGGEPGDLYAALLRSESLGPPMPRDLQSALQFGATDKYAITADMSVADAANVYTLFLEKGQTP